MCVCGHESHGVHVSTYGGESSQWCMGGSLRMSPNPREHVRGQHVHAGVAVHAQGCVGVSHTSVYAQTMEARVLSVSACAHVRTSVLVR